MAARAARGAGKATSPVVTWGPCYQPPAPRPAWGPTVGRRSVAVSAAGQQPQEGRAGGSRGPALPLGRGKNQTDPDSKSDARASSTWSFQGTE